MTINAKKWFMPYSLNGRIRVTVTNDMMENENDMENGTKQANLCSYNDLPRTNLNEYSKETILNPSDDEQRIASIVPHPYGLQMPYPTDGIRPFTSTYFCQSDTALDALSSSSSDYLSLDVAPMSKVYQPSRVPEFSDPCNACIPFSRGRYFQKNIHSTSIDGLSFPDHNYKGLSPNNEYNRKVLAWDGGGNGGHGFHYPTSHEDNHFTLVDSSLHADTCNKKTSVFSRLSFTEPRAQNDERHVIKFIEQVGLRSKSWHPVRKFKLRNMQNNSSRRGSTTDIDVGAADAFESEEDLGHSGGTVEEINESAFLDFKRRREARKAASETETVFSDHGGSSRKNKKRKLIRPSFSNEPCLGEGTSKFINTEDVGNTVICEAPPTRKDGEESWTTDLKLDSTF